LLSTLWVIGSGEAFIIEASFSQVAALRLAVSLASGILLSSIMHAIRVAQIRAVQHEARLTSFAKAAFEGIVESREGIIIDCNQQFADLAGCSISELKGSAISNLIALEDRNRVVENLIRNQESVIEHGIVRKDGSRLTVEAHGQPLIEGSDTRFAAVRDITERKIAESKLRDANIVLEKRVQERTAELAQRAAKLQALAGELTLAEQRERSRLAKILHDHLQHLLVAAKFRLTVLSKGEAGYIEVEELIDESIAASRSLTAELSPPILYEAGLTAGVKWLARRMAEKQGLSVELQVEESGSMPEHLKVLLFESIRELLFNVVKHAGTRSATVQLRHTKDSLQVVVADRGVGFDPALMPQPGEGGRGFGLFSIRERLELVGGEFEIRSAPNHGCRIALTVSLLQQGVHERSLTSSPIAEPSNHEPARANAADKTIRVLLADDHGIMREGMARVLGQEPDIQIVGQAADGIEAIKMADELLPQVILMDLSMPNLNGIDATRAIHGRHPEIHIIGLSMFEESDSAKAMRDAGAIAYLTKSGPPENLVSTIRQFGRPAAIAALISAD
jgi:PAS domain S-box-containing protein